MIPDEGVGEEQAVYEYSRFLAAYASDPNDVKCVAHLHCPTLSAAVAADMSASATNQSLDSWDQAPGASLIEARVCQALAALVYPDAATPDAIATTGATESNFVAILLAREGARRAGMKMRVVCGENAHHSIARAAWLAGVEPPVMIRSTAGKLDVEHAEHVLKSEQPGEQTLMVVTAGTTDTGSIDPLAPIADLSRKYGFDIHVDAAYGGPLILCDAYAHNLRNIDRSVTVAMDFHKFGWQPISCGVLVVHNREYLQPLEVTAEYLNSKDDVGRGFPDMLGRSIRTSRRPDLFKLATTLRATGRLGFERMIAACFAAAELLADAINADSNFVLWFGQRDLTTVLFRLPDMGRTPEISDNIVAEVRRRLLENGSAVLGRARTQDNDGQMRLWFKITVLNPKLNLQDIEAILGAIVRESSSVSDGLAV
ncbi:pyridoxal phosphate-dependent decarboxylase family protein [Rhodococcus sp. NPDC060176]|uniref:pyridoxal phosphate-dependent decarboxylase family protein n=1 Tax=Rhodococcus sp. NPDC060176 TaxID=3347062 RepID=UPI00365543B4